MSDVAATPANSATPESTQNDPQQSQPASAKQTAEPDKEPWRKVKHKYKAAGQEHEVDYDELIKRAEKAHGSEKRFQEAAQKEKEIKARLEKLQDPNHEDWDELIELIGFEKAKKFADKLVWDQIQWEELPEEKREALQAKQEAQRAKAELEKWKRSQAEKEAASQRQQAMSIIDNEIKSVLSKAKAEGLPVADIPEIEEMIIDEMIGYLEWMESEEKAGRPIRTPPPSHEDVLRKIQERHDQRSDVYLKRLPVETLKRMLTKEQLDGLRQAEIDSLYAPIPKSQGPKQSQEFDPFDPKRQPKKPERRMRTEEFFSKLDQAYGR